MSTLWWVLLAVALVVGAIVTYILVAFKWGHSPKQQHRTAKPTIFLEDNESLPAWMTTAVPPELVQKGQAEMARSHVVFLMVAKNVSVVLPLTLSRLETLVGNFADYTVCWYENNSKDDTAEQLRIWCATDPVRRYCLTETVDQPSHNRIQRIAQARENCVKLWTQSGRAGQADYVVVMDADLVGGFNRDGFVSVFASTRYDITWPRGYSLDSIVGPYSFIYRMLGWDRGLYDTLAIQQADENNQERRWWWQRMPGRMRVSAPQTSTEDPYTPLKSAFGGMAVYRADLYRKYGHYDTKSVECEHRVLHRRLRKEAGAEGAINRYWVTLR